MTNIENFLEWQRRQGINVIQSKSAYWYQAGPRVYQSFPYHWLIDPTEDELDSMMQEHEIIALRYSTPVQSPKGYISYHAVLENSEYGLAKLGRSTRKNIRHGLLNCRIEPISLERLADDGWQLQHDTLVRQGRHVHESQASWRTRCEAAAQLPGFEAWGAMVGDELAASVITYQVDDWMYFLYQQCQAKYLSLHVNNALSFFVTQKVFANPQVRFILYGLHSLDAPSSVDEFKFRMGYFPKAVRQRVVFNKKVSWLVNPATHFAVRSLLKLFPASSTLAKTEGMARFYLEGLKPIEQQAWPTSLEDQRESILLGNRKVDANAE